MYGAKFAHIQTSGLNTRALVLVRSHDPHHHYARGVERHPAPKVPERGARGRGSGQHSRFVEEALDVPASRRRLVLLRRAAPYAPTAL